MAITKEQILLRRDIWLMAMELVIPLVEDHGLETYKLGQPFSIMTVMTPVDQNIDHIERIANWLMDKE